MPTITLVKWTIVILNVSAVAAFILISSIATKSHQTTARRVNQELKAQNVLVERPGYDIEQRIGTIGGGGKFSSFIAQLRATTHER